MSAHLEQKKSNLNIANEHSSRSHFAPFPFINSRNKAFSL
jgi:hypothetical protein